MVGNFSDASTPEQRSKINHVTRCQFHQRSTYNFYTRGAQKRKMTMLT